MTEAPKSPSKSAQTRAVTSMTKSCLEIARRTLPDDLKQISDRALVQAVFMAAECGDGLEANVRFMLPKEGR